MPIPGAPDRAGGNPSGAALLWPRRAGHSARVCLRKLQTVRIGDTSVGLGLPPQTTTTGVKSVTAHCLTRLGRAMDVEEDRGRERNLIPSELAPTRG
jgi:hypothetical protein